MYENIKNFVDSLKNSFVVTGNEFIHINKVYSFSNVYYYRHHSHCYTEMTLVVDATTYHLENDVLQRETIQTLYLTVDTIEVIRATKRNIALLLVDESQLNREATQDYIRQKAS